MATKITVLKSEVTVPEGKKYKVCQLDYKTEEGKVKNMRIFGFGPQRPNFDVASKATKGDILDAQFQQNEKGYWEFQSIVGTGVKEAQAPTSNSVGAVPQPPVSKGNWETSEERAARQVYIVRQSSVSTAVDLLALNAKGQLSVDEVIKVAKQIEAYVFDKPAVEVTGEVE